MAVVQLQIVHKSGKVENLMGEDDSSVRIQHAPGQSQGPGVVVSRAATVPHGSGVVVTPAAKKSAPSGIARAPGFMVYIDPAVFDGFGAGTAERLAGWFSQVSAFNGVSFAVGPASTTRWPANLPPDLEALSSLLRRVRVERATCKSQTATKAAVTRLVRPPSVPPPTRPGTKKASPKRGEK